MIWLDRFHSSERVLGQSVPRRMRFLLSSGRRRCRSARQTSAAAVTVPAMPGGAPTVLPFFYQDPAAPWAMIKPNPRAGASPAPVEYPFAVGGDAFIPAALPVFAVVVLALAITSVSRR